MFYFEQASLNGRWWPVVSAERPVEKNGRIKRIDGTGPRIRAVQPLPDFLVEVLSRNGLDAVQAVMSPDGKFHYTHRGVR